MIWPDNIENKDLVVSVFGIDNATETYISKLSKKSNFVVGKTESWKEIISVSANLVIANLDCLSKDEKATIAKHYKDLEPSPDWIILTKVYKEFNGIKHVKVIDDFSDKNIKKIIDACLYESIKNHEKIDSIIRYSYLQNFLVSEPDITVDKLSLILREDKSTVLELIDDLSMAGADISITDEIVHCNMPIWKVF